MPITPFHLRPGAAVKALAPAHFSFTVFAFSQDIEVAYQRLKSQGVVFTGEPEKQSWGGWLATFKDPAGNQLQLVQHGD